MSLTNVFARIAIVGAVASLSLAASGSAAAPPGKLFAGVSYSKGIPNCEPVGFKVVLVLNFNHKMSMADAKKIEKQFRPRPGAKLKVNGHSYKLKRAPKIDHVHEYQAIWGYRHVKTSKSDGNAAVKKKARIVYDTPNGRQVATGRVTRYGCG